ncbi:MAG: ribbon-helix-helix domain-containing protein [archaeon]
MTKKWATSWKSVQIPEEYYKQIQDYVKSGKTGYASVSEYVRAALRTQLKEDQGIGNE